MLKSSATCAELPGGHSRQYALVFREFFKTAIPGIGSLFKGIACTLCVAFVIGNTLLLVYGVTLVWRFAFEESVAGPLRLFIGQ